MEINIKYSINESVWFMHSNKATNAYIYDLSISVTQKGCVETNYHINSIGTYKEGQLFKTREELIATI